MFIHKSYGVRFLVGIRPTLFSVLLIAKAFSRTEVYTIVLSDER